MIISVNRIFKRSISKWIREEDEKLLKLHEIYGPSWAFIAMNTPGRSPIECRRRYFTVTGHIEGPNSTPESDRMYRDGWEKSPSGDWIRIPIDIIDESPFSKLAARIPYFKKRWEKKAAGWLPEEKRAIIQGFVEFGPDWNRIAYKISRRTADQCRRVFEKEFILHASTGIPEVEAMKSEIFGKFKDNESAEDFIIVKCDD